MQNIKKVNYKQKVETDIVNLYAKELFLTLST